MENTTKTLAGLAVICSATIGAHAYLKGLVSQDNLKACVETAMDDWAHKHDFEGLVRTSSEVKAVMKDTLPDHERRISRLEGAVERGQPRPQSQSPTYPGP